MNELISAVSLVDQCVNITQPNNRQPISSLSLQTIDTMFVTATNLIGKCDTSSTLITNAAKVSALIKGLIGTGMIETDATAKSTLVDTLRNFYDDVLLEAAKYYRVHDFQYNMNLDPILRNILKAGLAAGLSFREEEVQHV